MSLMPLTSGLPGPGFPSMVLAAAYIISRKEYTAIDVCLRELPTCHWENCPQPPPNVSTNEICLKPELPSEPLIRLSSLISSTPPMGKLSLGEGLVVYTCSPGRASLCWICVASIGEA